MTRPSFLRYHVLRYHVVGCHLRRISAPFKEPTRVLHRDLVDVVV